MHETCFHKIFFIQITRLERCEEKIKNLSHSHLNIIYFATKF